MHFWTNESKTTRNVISRIPERSDYRPDPKSRTAREIAWQIVCEERMIVEALESGKVEWAVRITDGMELPLRHRSPPWPDNHLSAADGIDGAANLRAERRRAAGETHSSLDLHARQDEPYWMTCGRDQLSSPQSHQPDQ